MDWFLWLLTYWTIATPFVLIAGLFWWFGEGRETRDADFDDVTVWPPAIAPAVSTSPALSTLAEQYSATNIANTAALAAYQDYLARGQAQATQTQLNRLAGLPIAPAPQYGLPSSLIGCGVLGGLFGGWL